MMKLGGRAADMQAQMREFLPRQVAANLWCGLLKSYLK